MRIHTSKAESIRKKFRDWVQLRSAYENPQPMLESTVLSSGCYAGRRFSLMGFDLLWLIEQRLIHLHNPDGSLVATQSLDDFCNPQDPGKPLESTNTEPP